MATNCTQLVPTKRGRMMPSRPRRPSPNIPKCDSCILGDLKCVGLNGDACHSCIAAGGRCTLIYYSDSESGSDSDFYTATAMAVTRKRDPDTDSDVEAEDTVPTKKIKLEDVQVEDIDGEHSLAGDRAGKTLPEV
ncbi:hypothetical protein P692DRAFT_20882609 [Suillus brevipes Sb2]|nr:hypothetical protein P692DRAFT_20882609 [Suillus brevipes Sb2]